jgi:hypothetical protein
MPLEIRGRETELIRRYRVQIMPPSEFVGGLRNRPSQ